MRQVPRSPLSFKLQRVANVPEHPPPSTRLMSCAHIANRRLSRIIGASEPLGWYSHERIGHRICAVSNLPACIEADFPGNQSPMELTLCLVDPSSGSNVSCP